MSDFEVAVGKTFPWHELYVPDADKAKQFYHDLLGFTSESFQVPGESSGMEYWMLANGGIPIAGVVQTAGQPDMEHIPPHWTVYIAVDDVDGAVAKCEALGGGVIVPAMDVPTVGRMAMLRDNQGAGFWVYKSSNPVG